MRYKYALCVAAVAILAGTFVFGWCDALLALEQAVEIREVVEAALLCHFVDRLVGELLQQVASHVETKTQDVAGGGKTCQGFDAAVELSTRHIHGRGQFFQTDHTSRQALFYLAAKVLHEFLVWFMNALC